MDWVRNIKCQVGGYCSILNTSWREEVMKEEALVQSLYVCPTNWYNTLVATKNIQVMKLEVKRVGMRLQQKH